MSRKPTERARFARGLPGNLALALSLALGLAVACGTGDQASPPSGSLASASGSSTGAGAGAAEPNGRDVAFAQTMIGSHAQAGDLARAAAGRAADERVRALAARIEDAQDPEAEQLRTLLENWGEPVPDPPSALGAGAAAPAPGMDHGGTTMDHGGAGDAATTGLLDPVELAAVAARTGPDFDAAFLDAMIRHHQGAVVQAQDEMAGGASPRLRDLAAQVVHRQGDEIDQMQALRAG